MTTDLAAARAAARSRHPSGRWSVPVEALRIRVERALAARGVANPAVAAALLAVRGMTGLDREAFARRIGVPVATLAVAEDGSLARDVLPDALRRLLDGARGSGPKPA